jgi:SAM-dependent methyltransferase
MSIVFDWKPGDYDALVRSCDQDAALPYIMRYIASAQGAVLECGCGLGRWVEYLQRRGVNVIGIELNKETVKQVNQIAPHLSVREGNTAHLEFEDNSLAGIISLGVVEHFIDGPQPPLREMYRVLKPGHYAVITVPSFNHLRQVKYHIAPVNPIRMIKQLSFMRRLFRKDSLQKSGFRQFTRVQGVLPWRYRYQAYKGVFFEYHFTKREFEGELVKAGYEIVESVPIAHIDGFFHDISQSIVRYQDYAFHVTPLAKWLNGLFEHVPFFHNHMHLCVVRK